MYSNSIKSLHNLYFDIHSSSERRRMIFACKCLHTFCKACISKIKDEVCPICLRDQEDERFGNHGILRVCRYVSSLKTNLQDTFFFSIKYIEFRKTVSEQNVPCDSDWKIPIAYWLAKSADQQVVEIVKSPWKGTFTLENLVCDPET